VPFDKKIFRYPKIVAKMAGHSIDLSSSAEAKLLAGWAKDLRDSLTHPSSFIDPDTGEQQKIGMIVVVSLELAELLLRATREYIRAVETSLGRDPAKTVPWLS
jgi:hypothetical protein